MGIDHRLGVNVLFRVRVRASDGCVCVWECV